jgi:peptide/nickel transport system permease protein
MKGYRKYFGKKIVWFFLTLIIAFLLNFALPRMMPADPIASIMSRTARGITDTAKTKEMHDKYIKAFGLDKPVIVQFFTYVGNAIKGDFGLSFSQYPRKVNNIISSAILWTIALQMPAIIVGWLLGNILGALAAYIRKGFDKILMPISLFASCVPAFGMAVILLGVFAIRLKVAPIA